MSWSDYYRRRDAIDAVLERARRDPAAGLPVTEVAEVFAGPAELLPALHHRWLRALTGRVEVALCEAGADPVDAVSAAWHATAAEHPVLRRLLDEHAGDPALRPALEGEQRMLALAAGLAGPGEPAGEVSGAGAAFLALLRATAPAPRPRRRHLLRRLVASA
jgi:hypothetical protein